MEADNRTLRASDKRHPQMGSEKEDEPKLLIG